MKTESLSLFMLVLETGSISQAAKRAFISQQGASAAIKQLEKEFGCTLFERGPNGLRLTDTGRVFAQEAEAIMSAYRRLQNISAHKDSDEVVDSYALKVVATPYIMLGLHPIFDAYESERGATRNIDFIEKDLFDILDDYPNLDNNALYVINIPSFMENMILVIAEQFRPLAVSSLMLYCSPASPLGQKKIIQKHELQNKSAALVNDSLFMRMVDMLVRDIDGFDIRMQTSNRALIEKAVLEQDMVAFYDSLTVVLNPPSRKSTVIPIQDSPSHIIGILGNTHNKQGKALGSFIQNYLTTVCSAHAKQFPIQIASRIADETE